MSTKLPSLSLSLSPSLSFSGIAEEGEEAGCLRRHVLIIMKSDKDSAFQLPKLAHAFREFLVMTREVGEFVSGALAAAMTKAVLAPLETIRTRMLIGVAPKISLVALFRL
ncbi:putative mitochondrial adenine nucleotide transporter [Arachis hypogaea]|nr:putative mitochondrial adenine nucleotide transporter [Arachis hypogaea]